MPVQVRALRAALRRDEDRVGHPLQDFRIRRRRCEAVACRLPIRDQVLRPAQSRPEEGLLVKYSRAGAALNVALREHKQLPALQCEVKAVKLRGRSHGLDERLLGKLPAPIVHPGFNLRLHGGASVEAHRVTINVGVPGADPQLAECASARRGGRTSRRAAAVGLRLGRRGQGDGHCVPGIDDRQDVAQDAQPLCGVEDRSAGTRKNLHSLGERGALAAVPQFVIRPTKQHIPKPVLRVDGHLPHREITPRHRHGNREEHKAHPLLPSARKALRRRFSQ
mmetsp:Transcript_72200/g.209009  ORF Transcript_72200/g.209009 Transcript_72200/m.209009 type:complete len:279 (-) Transcript_72200:539-1375(-)